MNVSPAKILATDDSSSKSSSLASSTFSGGGTITEVQLNGNTVSTSGVANIKALPLSYFYSSSNNGTVYTNQWREIAYFIVEDGGGADAEMRFVYDDEGYVKEIRIDVLSHSDAGLSLHSTVLTEITKRKIGTVISDKLFDF